MWNKDYEDLTSGEKDEFRRIANYLLSHTYLTKYKYVPTEQMTLPNKDYQTATRFYGILNDYFEITGWRLNRDDNYGFMSLTNIFDHNRYRLEQFTTLFLYTCRLIYEEKRKDASSFHTVSTSTSEVIEKMTALGLLRVKEEKSFTKGAKTKQKDRRTTQKERLEAQRALAHFNIIEKMEATAWEPGGNQIIILPSILAIISNQGINDMMSKLEEISQDFEQNPDNEDEEAIQEDVQ